MLPVEQPFKTYTGLDGKPLNNGYVYFGQPGLNPITSPVTVFWDAAGTIPAFQPLRTVNGYIVNDANAPANVYFDSNYSTLVLDSKKRQVFIGSDSADFAVGPLVSSLFKAFGSSLVGFIQAGVDAVKRTLQDKARENVSFDDMGGIPDGAANNSAQLVKVLANMKTDRGLYELGFVKGDYLLGTSMAIDGSAALRFQNGARLVIPDGVTLTLNNPELVAGRQQIFKCVGTGKVVGSIKNALVYPEWWGAIADGLHPPVGSDFTERAAAALRNGTAIAAAIAFAGYAYAATGIAATVSPTFGDYVTDRAPTIPLSTNFIGQGICSAFFLYSATGNGLECTNGNNSLVSDIFIAPIAGPTWNESSGFGVYFDGVSTPCIRNVWSSGFTGGTYFFKNVIEGRISGLVSDNSHGPAFTIRGVGQGTVLSNCITAGTTGGACFDIQSGYDWHLIGCTAKDGAAGTIGYYLNACENINLTACGAHDINKQGILTTASTLNCTINGCFVNGASTASPGTYAAMDISGTRNRLIAPKVTQNTPSYSYALVFGGAATDCTYTEENFTPGTLGTILDGQPIGANTTKVRKVSTTDATPLTVWSKSLNNSAGCTIEATVTMKQRGAAGESASFKVWGRAVTGTGGTTIATGSVYSSKSNAASTVNAVFVLTSAAANAGVVALQVTGLAGVAAIDWEATVSSVSVTG